MTIFAGLTPAAARRRLAALLTEGGCEPAALEARHLLQHAMGVDHAGLLRGADVPLASTAAEQLQALADRRLSGEPLSRILGHRFFCDLRLEVRPGVLDPREDTEAIVRLARTLRPDRNAVKRVLDLGTGSGALLCALLAAYPDACGVGVDRSFEACQLARDNATSCGLGRRAAVICSDWAAALTGPFDLVVSNPPYIEREVVATLAREVRDHDPELALDGGPDGLDAYRAILAGISRVGRPGALAVFEIGAGQRASVEALLTAAGLRPCGAEQDLGGHVRALAAELP